METEIIDKLFLELAQFTTAKLKPDWRAGLAVTPKMRTHYWKNHLGVIRKIHPAKDGMAEMIDVELYHGDRESTMLHEPSSEWMTA